MPCQKEASVARSAPRISSVFLVVESARTVREALCFALLSFGIKGIPVSSRSEALAAIKAQRGIEGAIVDIDNRDVDGIQLVNDLKAGEDTRRIAVIVHTIQTRKDFVRKMVEIGVAGYLLKPFSPETAKTKLEAILLKLSTHNASRRHIRVTPDPDELTRVSFRLRGLAQLMSGRIVDISLGGMAIELFNPPADTLFTLGIPIARLDFALAGKALSPSGSVVVCRSRVLAVKFETISVSDRQALERYIFKRISS
jgi:two-component system, chemotaxis family, chemotaxis protein CheY